MQITQHEIATNLSLRTSQFYSYVLFKYELRAQTLNIWSYYFLNLK